MSAPLKLSFVFVDAKRGPLERLMTQLDALFVCDIRAWVQIAIRPGLYYKADIAERLLESDLVLYLVYPGSLQPFCYEKELLALKAQGRVIPVLMRDALLSDFPILSDVQALPQSGIPVLRTPASADSHLAQLAKEISREVARLRRQKYGFDKLVPIDPSVRELLGRIPVEFVDGIIAAEISGAFFNHLSEFGTVNGRGDTRLHKRVLRALNTARDRLARELLLYHPTFADQLADAVFVQWAIMRGLVCSDGARAEGSSASSFVEAMLSYVREILVDATTALERRDARDLQLPVRERRTAASIVESLISVSPEKLPPMSEGQPRNMLIRGRMTSARQHSPLLVRALPFETQQLAA